MRATFGADTFAKKQVPEQFIYMPAGVHRIVPDYDGMPIEIFVNVHEKTVAAIKACVARVKERYPNLQFYADDEKHSEDKATFREPMEWDWGTIKGVTGVKLKARATSLGRQEIEDELYITHSPSFDSDADYDKLVESPDNILRFPAGARGSKENPAEVTMVGLSVFTLTNDPAFRNMPLLAARNRGGDGADDLAAAIAARNQPTGGDPAGQHQRSHQQARRSGLLRLPRRRQPAARV